MRVWVVSTNIEHGDKHIVSICSDKQAAESLVFRYKRKDVEPSDLFCIEEQVIDDVICFKWAFK